MNRPGPRLIALEAREVPLGGLRDMSVQRVLPSRDLPTIGAWCFLDRFGPQRVTMRVEPHPHTGLQTVTWPLTGRIRHRDTLGSDVILDVGQLNLMTAGDGVAHSEYSLGADDDLLDALQLWIALPDGARTGSAGFESHVTLPVVTVPAVRGADATATVVMGGFAGVWSPATTYSPLVGAQVFLPAGSVVDLPLDPAWEHGLVQVLGDVTVEDGAVPLPQRGLIYLGDGRASVRVATETDATVFVLGGEPFGEDLVMWWNFIGRTHEEIVEAREDWEARSERFGTVAGHGDVRIPAPPLPGVRLTPRRRRAWN
ncbi:pirin family protein [Demequina sp. NBRC 110055]|uniref:pirin family protein n=1 Tax=Demequina sp. NBRC 110055 TaxID=1570344 RepID=UPI0009FCBA04|nr:pirin family protein [Demequina sp. NBRC 110055]